MLTKILLLEDCLINNAPIQSMIYVSQVKSQYSKRERSADTAESWRHGFKPFWHCWISAAQAETLQVCCFQNAWPQVAVVTVEQLHDSQ